MIQIVCKTLHDQKQLIFVEAKTAALKFHKYSAMSWLFIQKL